jgi:phosphomannomutase
MNTIKPKLTVSGYRGIWGEDLDEQTAFEFALAFAKIIKKRGGKKILVGRDARKSGNIMLSAIKSAVEKEGLMIDDAGIIPTPSILLFVTKLSYGGGIIITASHNPIEYNGLKFVMGNGYFAAPDEIEEINQNKETLNEKYIPNNNNFDSLITEENNNKFRKLHINEILKNINIDLIKNKKYKVALDPINSAGSIVIPELLKELGCIVNIINGDQSGEFAHTPEPLTHNLNQISMRVKESGSDIGFAVDPDADRLVIVNEKGEILSEEYTLALAVKNVLGKNPSDVVINMSSSRLCEDITNSFGKKVFRSKIGELNVVKKMVEVNSNISGEGNGGVIYPKINTARDSMVGIALVLELMANENKTISQIIEELPHYLVQKEKIVFGGDMNLLYNDLKKEFIDANNIDTLDGIRFDWDDSSWIHIRRSNTEPKMWIISEAKNKERIDELFEKAKKIINNVKQ